MASSFAAQLNEIATRSTNELDLKAQKTAHSQSLIFEKRVAGLQDFDTIYQLCLEGFEDLCHIDPRFREFQRSLFSPHSKTQERDQMTADQNAKLDTVIEACLGLLGARLLLSPAVKVAEWLVRRFRVHEYNTSFLLLTFLPYHTTPVFRNLLSILPSLPPQFRLLRPYVTTATNPPRHAIVYAAINNDGFFSACNAYVLQVCRAGSQQQTLLSFWASTTAEAVVGRLDLAKSGRKEIQRQREEDVLLKVLPVVKDGLSMHECSDIIIACYTITIILVNKSLVADKLVDSLIEAVVGTLRAETMDQGLICLSILTQNKSDQSVNWGIMARVAAIHGLEKRLQTLNKAYGVGALALAMIQGALSSMQSKKKSKKQSEKLDFVERLLLAELMDPPKTILAVGSLLEVLKSADQGAVSDSVKDSVVDLLRRLNDSDAFSSLIVNAAREVGVCPETLETSLQSLLRFPEGSPPIIDEMDIDVESPVEAEGSLDRALGHVPHRTVEEHSFLSDSPSHLFKPLLVAFKLAAQSEEGMKSFSELPLWKSSDLDEPLFASFFVRVFSGPYSAQVRQAALMMVKAWLSDHSNFDSQAILPYVLLQLADPARKIRKAASEALLAMAPAFPSALVNGESFKQWGVDELYTTGKDVTFLPTQHMSKILHKAVLPALEECILDSTQIKRVFENALKSRPTNNRAKGNPPSAELKKSIKESFFRLFLTHLLATPLYSVKTGLLNLVENVERAGNTLKRKALMPLLLHWASLGHEDVKKLASEECLDVKDITSAFCGVISLAETDFVDVLFHLTSSTNPKRSDLVSAISERIQNLWPKLQTERRVSAAETLLGYIYDDKGGMSPRSHIAEDVFQSVSLSTEVLVHLLDSFHSSINTATEHSSVSKKRRNNDDQAVATNSLSSGSRHTEIRKITFLLELIDNSSPEGRPELLSGLFDVLATLQRLRTQDQSDLSYLLALTLGSLLGIVRNATLHGSKLKFSIAPVDAVIECMRATGNSQVQNTALLLIAAIGGNAPERVLNSIMPVFTLVGTKMLERDDEYSTHVVDQIMDKVLPPLIHSLRNRGEDVIVQTSDLVSSFVVAYEHMPVARRFRVFKKLISNLGDETFLWVILSKLALRYPDEVGLVLFIVSLFNGFEVDVQLKTCVKLVAAVRDALANHTNQQAALTRSHITQEVFSSTTALPLLQILDQIFTKSNAGNKMARMDESNENDLAGLMPLSKDLLNQAISLVHTPNLNGVLSTTADAVLSSLLGILPLIQFIDITDQFVQDGPELARQKVLRVLESRMRVKDAHNSRTQSKAISFLPVLFGLLRESGDEISKRAAIACVDRICEAYGRKHTSVVIQAARVVSEDCCLGSSDRRLNTLSLLCFSSMVDLVKEAIVPVIPQLMPKVWSLLLTSLDEGLEDSQLHNAAFSVIAGLLTHVPFIISDEYLDQIMTVSAESKNAELGAESDEIRGQALQLLSKNIQLPNIVGSLHRTWSIIVENDVLAVRQSLSLLADSVQKSPKAVVMKNADKIWSFLLETFNLRRIQFTNRTEDSYSDVAVSEIENTVNSVAIEVIYKLNDTIFRPLFLRYIDWATKCQDIQSSNLSKAQQLRQTTLFNFLAHFFNTLKSIVTSYATYMVDPALSILNDISTASSSAPASTPKSKAKSKLNPKPQPPSPSSPDTTSLYLSTLHALHAALRHDTTSHFSTPHLFTPLSITLTTHLHLASPHLTTTLIPTIVALATAAVDSPDHLKSLNGLICTLRRSPDTRVRAASVRCQLALAGVPDGVGPVSGIGHGGQDEEVEGGAEAEAEAKLLLAEEWCSNILSVGEGMVYVNEMLEDEDEEVEGLVRRLVGRVREVGGEEAIFE